MSKLTSSTTANMTANTAANITTKVLIAINMLLLFWATPAQAGLQSVGAIVPENGFPQYYQDSSGLALTQCLDTTGLCNVIIPNSLQPATFPTNFPLEFLYWNATSILPTNNGGQALVDFSLSGSFSTLQVLSGDQVVFARMRVRMDNLVAGATYRITHPFGVDSFVALSTGARGVNRTVDIGLCPGDFQAALAGRVGPFLVWDPAESAPPLGYVGDPGVFHTALGSPNGTNFVRIEGPSVGGAGVNLIESKVFAITGKLETAPVPQPLSPQRASYSRSASGSQIAVFVDSVASASLSIAGSNVAAQLLTSEPTTGKFFGFLSLAAGVPLPATLLIQNIAAPSSAPVSAPVSVPVVDQVSIAQAVYDPLSQRLRIDAGSADLLVPPALTVAGLGVIPPSGSLIVGTFAPPATVVVTSSSGGRAMQTVVVMPGAVPSTTVPTAKAGVDQVVAPGATVLLAGTLSGFGTATLAWSQLSGPTVLLNAGAAAGAVTFVAPAVAATTNLVFRLTASGTSGGSTDDVIVTVAGPTTKAVIQALAPVALGSTVNLDGSASTGGVTSWAWLQTAGPAVTLVGSTASKATFVFPATAVVGQPGGIAALQFKLTVSGPNGTSSAVVNVSNIASSDTLTVTNLQYRTKKLRWDIAGTATVTTNNAVTAFLGLPSAGKPIAKATVAANGAWLIQALPATVVPKTGDTVYLVSDKGGQLGGVAITITAN